VNGGDFKMISLQKQKQFFTQLNYEFQVGNVKSISNICCGFIQFIFMEDLKDEKLEAFIDEFKDSEIELDFYLLTKYFLENRIYFTVNQKRLRFYNILRGDVSLRQYLINRKAIKETNKFVKSLF
jgi:hypothetical protein